MPRQLVVPPPQASTPHRAGTPAGPDPGTMGWGQVLQHAAGQVAAHAPDLVFGPAFGMIPSAYHSAKQALGYAPTATGPERTRAFAERGLMGIPTNVTLPGAKPMSMPSVADLKATGQEPIDYVRNRYGDPATAKRTLYNDAPGAAQDALAALTIARGGAGLLKNLPGPAGEIAGRASNLAGDVANPARVVKRVMHGPPPVDAAGNLHPNVKASFEAAAPGSSAELDVNPNFKQHAINTMTTKGVNTPAARDALISYHQDQGTPVSRATTMNTTPPPGKLRDASDTMNADSQQAIAARMKGTPGARGPAGSAPAMLATNPDGTFVNPTSDIRAFTQTPGVTSGPLASSPIFGPTEASDVRLATHAQDVLQAKPPTRNFAPGWMGPSARRAVATAATGAAGFAAAPFIHVAPTVAAGVGGAGGFLGEHVIDPYFENRAMVAAQSGAPVPGKWAGRAAQAGDVYGLATAAALPGRMDQATQPKPPEGLQAPAPQPFTPPAPTPAPAAAPTPGAEPAPAAAAPPPEEGTTDYANMPLHDDEPVAAAPEPAPHGKAAKAAAAGAGDDYANMPLDDKADGGRVGRAAGGQVGDLAEQLLKRASMAGRASQEASRPLLGLSDDHVAQALRMAARGV